METSWLKGRCLTWSWIPPLRTPSPYFLPYGLKANKQREKKNQITEIVICLPFKSLTRFDYLNKSIWIWFKFQGTQLHSAYHESHLPLHMVILITQMLLCAPLLTRARCAPHQTRLGKGGAHKSNNFHSPVETAQHACLQGTFQVLSVKDVSNRNEKGSSYFQGERHDLPNLEKEEFALEKLWFASSDKNYCFWFQV